MKILETMATVLVLMGSVAVFGQDLSVEVRNEVIGQVIDQLANRYIDPNLGKKAAETITQKKEALVYDDLDTKASLIRTLIADMHAATNDKHLQLVDSAGFGQVGSRGHGAMRPNIQVFNPNATSKGDTQRNKLIQEMLKRMNYGLKDPKILEGKCGYLDIRQLTSPRMAPDVYQAIDKTMQAFEGCAAMILDLRFCTAGGDPDVVLYLASYFLGGEESQTLYTSFNHENEKIAEFNTRTDMAGKRLPNIPLYILVSSRTFSAGEMFAYGLQKVRRATIVGETTAGAAHGTDTIGIGHGIMMVLPVTRLAHVKTKTDWEGTGVIPDVPTKADEALNTAQDLIRKK